MLAALADDERRSWLTDLPLLVADIAARWHLTVGDPYEPGGTVSWVAPVIDSAGMHCVLKVGWPHAEAASEAAGLREWDGETTVRLLQHESRSSAEVLLLERCTPGQPLRDKSESEQDEVIAGLLPRLHKPCSDSRFPTLVEMCDSWVRQYRAARVERPPKPDSPTEAKALALFEELPRSADQSVLLWTDLHAGNVLSATREPWLAIDPKPHVGDPTYDALQHMLNCRERLTTDPLHLINSLAEKLSLETERLRLWTFARCVMESLEDPELLRVAEALY